MSVIKEINKAIKSTKAIVKINGISYLRRWTKTALGEDVDRLELVFCPIGGISKGGSSYSVESRDLDGIIIEIETYTTEYLKEVAERAAKNLRAGYR